MGPHEYAWSNCRWDISEEVVSTAEAIVSGLRAPLCLASAPPDGSDCEATLELLTASEPCPDGTETIEPGICGLPSTSWSLETTPTCTEARVDPGLAVSPGAGLRVQCRER
jgi:hypothetical protein